MGKTIIKFKDIQPMGSRANYYAIALPLAVSGWKSLLFMPLGGVEPPSRT